MKNKNLKIAALKHNLYNNCKVYCPEGDLLFRTGPRKIQWYLSRNLGEPINFDENNNPIDIKLNFVPKGKGNVGDYYHMSHKENQCVICGDFNNLSRHHVVPRCYRTYFPESLKEHNSHDVLPLCLKCHSDYEVSASNLKKKLAEIYDAPIHGENFYKIQKMNRAIGYAKNIVELPDIIPAKRRKAMEKFIAEVMEVNEVNDDFILDLAEKMLLFLIKRIKKMALGLMV